MSNEDWERARNLAVFKFWGTNEERDAAAPFVIVCWAVTILLLLGGLYFFGVFDNQKEITKINPTREGQEIKKSHENDGKEMLVLLDRG